MAQPQVNPQDSRFAQEMAGQGQHLLQIARQILGDWQWAEDAVAETYLKAWQKRHTLRDPQRLGPWLVRICRNQALSLLRQRRSTRVVVLPEERLAEQPARPESAESGYEADLLDRLPEELKTCARLFFCEGQSYSQIAVRFGLPLSTVRGRIYLSRQHLRKEIEMTQQRTMVEQSPEEILEPRGKALSWRGARIRFLGLTRLGSGRLYDAAGRRQPRLPAILKDSSIFQNPYPKEFPGRAEHKLGAYWELRGGESVSMYVEAQAGRGRQILQPSGIPEERRGGTRIICLTCGAPDPQEREIRIVGYLLGPDDPGRAFRFVPGEPFGGDGTGWISCSGNPWGALFIAPRVPGPTAGTCSFTVALSSPEAERGCRILAVDGSGREIEPLEAQGGSVSSMAGHLHAQSLVVPLAPKDVAGIVVHPRHAARVDWGRMHLPPRAQDARAGVR